jgi:predicted metal-dependent hydrolase
MWDGIPAGEPRLLEGAALFNAGRFFESHEVWESLWHQVRGPQRELLQGLIQTAAAYYHLGRGNHVGARYLAERARVHLQPWRPSLAGVGVDGVLEQLSSLTDGLEGGRPSPRPSVLIDRSGQGV